MSNFHRRLSFGGISPSKFVQKHLVGGVSPKKFVQKHSVGEISPKKFVQKHSVGGISPKKFVQKHSVGGISPKKGLRQPSAGAYGQKRRRRKGKRSFGGRGKTVNEKRNAGHTQANPTCTRHNNSTIQQFNRAKPSTTQRAKGANNSTSIHEHLLRACFSLSQRQSGRRTSVAAD